MSDDLVYRLRSEALTIRLCEEAADRIDELEVALKMYADDKIRIDVLETRIAGLEMMLVDADKHGQKLEAALHEIIAWWESEDEDIKVMEIATRALRGKS